MVKWQGDSTPFPHRQQLTGVRAFHDFRTGSLYSCPTSASGTPHIYYPDHDGFPLSDLGSTFQVSRVTRVKIQHSSCNREPLARVNGIFRERSGAVHHART